MYSATAGEVSSAPGIPVNEVLPRVYHDLRRIAAQCLNRDWRSQTLQPTALVHEAYMRLAGGSIQCESETHFINIVVRLMRQILVEQARRRSAARRGSGIVPLPLEEVAAPADHAGPEILAIDEALHSLAAVEERKSRIVELRYFGGFTTEEISELLGISTRTVEREMKQACAWLHRWITGEEPAA